MSLLSITVSYICMLLVVAIVADRLLFPNVAWQDFVWRVTLVALLLTPVLSALSSASWPEGLIRIPAYRIATEDSPAPRFGTGSEQVNLEPVVLLEPPVDDVQQDRDDVSGGESAFVASPIQPVEIATKTLTPKMVANRPQDNIPESGFEIPWQVVGLLVWCAGSLLLMVRFTVGWLAVHKVVAGAQQEIPADWSTAITVSERQAGLKSSIRVMISGEIESPMVVGIADSTVLMPETMLSCPGNDPRIQAALLHEATHIQRADPFWNLLLSVCVSIWWPIPMIHWMKSRMIWLRELLCDEPAAVNMGPANYSESLLILATESNARHLDSASIPMTSRNGSLESRIEWILNLSKPLPKPGKHRQLTCACCVLLILFGLMAIKLVPVQATLASSQSSSPTVSSQEQEKETAADDSEMQCRGVVQTKGGEALAGATVYLLKRVGNTLPTYPLTTTTNSHGQYSFTDVGSGKYRIWAEGAGLTSLKKFLGGARVEILANQTAPVVKDITVERACNYRLEVVAAETGTPIEGAKITFGWTDIERTYATGMDGVAEINGLASNDWYFVVKADGFATFFKKAAPQELGTTTDLRFEMNRGVDVAIELRDQNGEAVSGAIIEVQYDKLGMTPHLLPYPSRTGPNGILLAKGMPLNEKLRLIVGKDGYRFGHPTVEFDLGDELEALKITGEKLPYGGDIEVEVKDEGGQPIEGAIVKNPSTSSGRYRQAKTGRDGKALLANLYPHFENRYVIIKADGKIPQRIDVEPGPEGKPSKVQVVMEAGRTLRGALLTPDGKPSPRNTRIYYNQGEHGDWAGGRVLTDEKGKFEIVGLPDETTLTVYTPQQYEPINDMKVELDQLGGDTIKIIKMTPAASIRVRAVDDATGEPIPEFNVRLGFVDRDHRQEGDKSGGGIRSNLVNPGTNIHGTKKFFRLGHQVAGVVYKVIVSARGYETQTIQRMKTVVEAESEIVDVRLTKAKQ